MQNKLETISNLFEGKEIRSIWDKDKEESRFFTDGSKLIGQFKK